MPGSPWRPRSWSASSSDDSCRGGKGPRRASVDAARLAAYDVLVAVREDDSYANLVLPQLLRERRIEGRDAAFTTELVGGTLRGLGAYDAVIDHLAGRRPDASVRDALRLGAHQLLAMRVPDHAAVTSTVELVRTRVGHKPAGFTNAVLRRITERDLDVWMDLLEAPTSIRFSHPQWIVDELARALDRPDELEALLAADNARPRVTLVARPGLSTVEELASASTEPVESTLSPLGVVLESGDPGAIPAVRDGRAGVQDAGSQLVALALARASVDGPDGRWLDLCAGPGGKAALLGALATERGARLLANERQPHRAKLVASALRATSGDVVVGDGTRPPWAESTFDRVLVDAPCTGLGALRRRPESRWRRTPDDLRVLVPLQQALLRSALDSVRPGGVVLYATCSPAVEETVRRGRVCPGGPARHPTRGHPRAGPRGDRRRVGPPPGRRTAVAAPPRHRRDVHGPAPAAGHADDPRIRVTMGIQITPSILNADLSRLADEVGRIPSADWVHVDVMDNHFVPNLTLGLPVFESLAKSTDLPLDAHLMIEDPDRWAPAYAEAGAGSVTFHAEAAQAPVRLARELRAKDARAGMALKPDTPIEPYADMLGELDMLLVMTVEPGSAARSSSTCAAQDPPRP